MQQTGEVRAIPTTGTGEEMSDIDLDQLEGHTPGPWEATRMYRPEGCFDPDGAQCNIKKLGKEYSIATVWRRKPYDACEIDAALIASAPELLSKCVEFQSSLDRVKDIFEILIAYFKTPSVNVSPELKKHLIYPDINKDEPDEILFCAIKSELRVISRLLSDGSDENA